MTHRLRALVGAVLLVVAGLAAAPAALAGDPCFHGYSIPPSTTSATTAVDMEPCAFLPTNATIATGATVTFTNTSAEPHILTGANQAWGDREREIRPGESVSVTFDEAGVYAYSCALHRGMSGAVIAGGATAVQGDATVAGSTGTAGGASSDVGIVPLLAIVSLAALAAVGWGVALVQRRRVVAEVRSERLPAA